MLAICSTFYSSLSLLRTKTRHRVATVSCLLLTGGLLLPNILLKRSDKCGSCVSSAKSTIPKLGRVRSASHERVASTIAMPFQGKHDTSLLNLGSPYRLTRLTGPPTLLQTELPLRGERSPYLPSFPSPVYTTHLPTQRRTCLHTSTYTVKVVSEHKHSAKIQSWWIMTYACQVVNVGKQKEMSQGIMVMLC